MKDRHSTTPAPEDCLSCGACCAPPESWKSYCAVTEYDYSRLPRPVRLLVLNGELRTRRREGGVRCVCLEGQIGQSVRCRIHVFRPDACRRFEVGSTACLEARRDVLSHPAFG